MNKQKERAEVIRELVRLADIHRDCGRLVSKDGTAERVLREAAAMLDAQPAEQANELEAVGWISAGGLRELSEQGRAEIFAKKDYECIGTVPLYTTPPAQPAREWVGLTDDERHPMIKRCAEYYGYSDVPLNMTAGAGFWFLTKDVESKLKEKNGN